MSLGRGLAGGAEAVLGCCPAGRRRSARGGGGGDRAGEGGPRSEIPPVKYAQIQGSNFGRNFHGKCKISYKFMEFAGNSNNNILYEHHFHDFLRFPH